MSGSRIEHEKEEIKKLTNLIDQLQDEFSRLGIPMNSEAENFFDNPEDEVDIDILLTMVQEARERLAAEKRDNKLLERLKATHENFFSSLQSNMVDYEEELKQQNLAANVQLARAQGLKK